MTPPLGPRLLLLPVGVAALLVGMLGGLARLGVFAQAAPAPSVAGHGPLVLFGFFGVLVGLERAVALRRWWAFAGPVAAAAGSASLLAGVAPLVAASMWTASGVVAGAAVLRIEQRHPSLANRSMLASCAAWAIGAALWGSGAGIGALLPWWAAFLVLMIVGERIQFGKLFYYPRTTAIVSTFTSLLLAGALVATTAPTHGMRLAGASLLALGAWLLAVDVRRRARRPGLLRFVSVAMGLANGWLVVAGLVWLLAAPVVAGGAHDAAIHALFQGFALGMVMAHAPMIFPAVTGLRMPYRPSFYLHLSLLHAGLAARVLADLVEARDVARTGSTLTAAATVLFVVAMAISALRVLREREPEPRARAAERANRRAAQPSRAPAPRTSPRRDAPRA